MPYIKQEDRNRIFPFVESLFAQLETQGDVNYAMTCLLHLQLKKTGQCYDNANNTHGIATCVADEFYRKVVAPYEDIKESDNGEIGIL